MNKILLLLVYLCLVNSNESKTFQHLDDVIGSYEQSKISSKAEENAGLFEGDIVIDESTKRYLIGGDITSRDAIVIPTYYWPGGVLYYTFDENLTPNTVDVIERGIDHLKERTCIKFVKIYPFDKLHKSYVKFISGNGCYSRIGRDPDNKEQVISIGSGCERIGTVVHEIMHALGFFHEHTRPDRDKYVTIDWTNIRKEHSNNFKKYSRDIGSSFGKPYDYESLMHYSKEAFCLDCDKPTITPADKKAIMGQRIGLSYYDRKEVDNLYKCKEDCVDTISPFKCLVWRMFGSCLSPSFHETMIDVCPKSCNFCATRKRRIKASKDTTTTEQGTS